MASVDLLRSSLMALVFGGCASRAGCATGDATTRNGASADLLSPFGGNTCTPAAVGQAASSSREAVVANATGVVGLRSSRRDSVESGGGRVNLKDPFGSGAGQAGGNEPDLKDPFDSGSGLARGISP